VCTGRWEEMYLIVIVDWQSNAIAHSCGIEIRMKILYEYLKLNSLDFYFFEIKGMLHFVEA
jgi:hypothetical protein